MLFKKIRSAWDWWIYRRAISSIRRIAEDNPAYSYLFELQIHDINRQAKASEALTSSVLTFYRATTSK